MGKILRLILNTFSNHEERLRELESAVTTLTADYSSKTTTLTAHYSRSPLSPQLQKLWNTLLDSSEPLTAKDLARRLRVNPSSLRSYLFYLKKRGYVVLIDKGFSGKEFLYSVSSEEKLKKLHAL